MWSYNYNDELYHYGILGMKWGVRRYQNKDGSLTSAGKKRASNKEVREKRESVFKKEYSKLEKEYGISEKKKDAIAYGRKNNLDLDDGGGGNVKAGMKYLSMWDKIDELERRADSEASRRTTQYLIDTYGEKKLKSVERADIARGVAAMAVVLGLPIAAMGVSIALEN